MGKTRYEQYMEKRIAELEAENAELKAACTESISHVSTYDRALTVEEVDAVSRVVEPRKMWRAGMLEAAAIVEPYIGEWEVSLRTIVEKIREAAKK
jgi:hypothetical protein